MFSSSRKDLKSDSICVNPILATLVFSETLALNPITMAVQPIATGKKPIANCIPRGRLNSSYCTQMG